MEVSGHIAAPATLSPENAPPVTFADEHIYVYTYIRGLEL